MSTHSQKLYWIHIWKLKGLIDKDRSLPPVCKAVAWQLLDHYNLETGKCYPSHQTLAEECNYKLKQVKNATRNEIERDLPNKVVKTLPVLVLVSINSI